MSDDAGEAGVDPPDDRVPGAHAGDTWALDAALGAASLVARTVGAVGSSTPGRVVGEATRRLTGPLAREGHDVRELLGEEATPTAKRIVAQVTPRVTEVVDLNEILAGIDLDALLERIDLDLVLERIDLDALLGRIDIEALVGRIDLNAVMAGVDVQELVANTEIGGLLAMSSSSVISTILDGLRGWVVRVDSLVGRLVNRLLRRDPGSLPVGPPRLVGPPELIDTVATDPPALPAVGS